MAKLVAPFLAELRMRVERRQDLANMVGELLFRRMKGGKLVDSVNGSSDSLCGGSGYFVV